MSSLPEDIYHQILLRLPVKSTFACKCVCKSWLSLISDPNFAKLHLDLIPHGRRSSYLMVEGRDYTKNIEAINSVSYDSIEPSLWEKSEFTEMCYPYKSLQPYGLRIAGSSNGLVCLMFYDLYSLVSNGKEFFFCVWNPATHEFKKVIKPTDGIEFSGILMCAFGYDHKNGDYKLVIGVDSDEETSTAVYFYTLESDSWKSPITVPYHFSPYRKSGVLVNGDFHFLADKREGSLLVSLDIEEERFTEIEFSRELKLNGHWFITEAVLEGCLCVLTVFRNFGPNTDTDDQYPTRVEVWVMQHYGVPESWTKRYIITHEVITRKIMGPCFPLRFVSASKNGEILMMMDKLILCNPKNGSAIERDTGSVSSCSEANYFESLISVNSGTYVGGRIL